MVNGCSHVSPGIGGWGEVGGAVGEVVGRRVRGGSEYHVEWVSGLSERHGVEELVDANMFCYCCCWMARATVGLEAHLWIVNRSWE